MKRRDFVKSTAALSVAASLPWNKLNANPKIEIAKSGNNDFLNNDSIMIIVELFGGNDGLNTIIPADNDIYYQMRPNISLKKSDTVQFESSDVFFHPGLVKNVYNNGFQGLLSNGNLAIIEGVGYDNMTMSHFQSQAIYESGIISLDPKVPLVEGWLGKYFASKLTEFPLVIPENPLAINMGGDVPLTFRSSKGHMGIALNDPGTFGAISNVMPIEKIRTGDAYFDNEYNFIHTVAKQTATYSNAIDQAWKKGKNAIQYPNGNVVSKFQQIARLISGGLKTKVYYVRMSSFDFHTQQMRNPMDGQHPGLLQQLSHAISNFMKDAITQGFQDRVAILTSSEFGRRVHDNGSRGTDHGAACVQFMLADNANIISGRIGDKPDLGDLDNNSNLRHQFDFRRIYADFLEVWFGATHQEVEQLLGTSDIVPMGILKPRTSYIEAYLELEEGKYITISPNPINSNSKIEFNLKTNANVQLDIFSYNGELLRKVLDPQFLPNGHYELPLGFVKSGVYILSLIVNGRRIMEKFVA